MTCGLVHASYSLPKWQAVKLTFFAPCDGIDDTVESDDVDDNDDDDDDNDDNDDYVFSRCPYLKHLAYYLLRLPFTNFFTDGTTNIR